MAAAGAARRRSDAWMLASSSRSKTRDVTAQVWQRVCCSSAHLCAHVRQQRVGDACTAARPLRAAGTAQSIAAHRAEPDVRCSTNGNVRALARRASGIRPALVCLSAGWERIRFSVARADLIVSARCAWLAWPSEWQWSTCAIRWRRTDAAVLLRGKRALTGRVDSAHRGCPRSSRSRSG